MALHQQSDHTTLILFSNGLFLLNIVFEKQHDSGYKMRVGGEINVLDLQFFNVLLLHLEGGLFRVAAGSRDLRDDLWVRLRGTLHAVAIHDKVTGLNNSLSWWPA